MYWLFMDFRFLYILLPAILLGLYAQFKVKSTYSKYSRVNNSRGWTAAQVARKILDDNGLYDVQIAHISGSLTDNFNPKTMTVSLSDTVYSSSSVAAIGVAAHECGHAVQHAEQYLPIKIRSALVPVTNFGSSIGFIVLAAGLIFSNYSIAMFGVLLYSLMAVFQLVTLPVEYNASSRALATIEGMELLRGEELDGAAKVLRAAALTYVAALAVTLMQLLRFVLILSNRRD